MKIKCILPPIYAVEFKILFSINVELVLLTAHITPKIIHIYIYIIFNYIEVNYKVYSNY